MHFHKIGKNEINCINIPTQSENIIKLTVDNVKNDYINNPFKKYAKLEIPLCLMLTKNYDVSCPIVNSSEPNMKLKFLTIKLEKFIENEFSASPNFNKLNFEKYKKLKLMPIKVEKLIEYEFPNSPNFNVSKIINLIFLK